MKIWLLLLLPSLFWGALCGFLIKKEWGAYLAGIGPFSGLFMALIYTVYLGPNADGGDGFWIIALIFGGAIAAFTGIFSYKKTRTLLKINPEP